MPYHRTFPAIVLILSLSAAACGEDLQTVNQPGRITSAGPVISQPFGVYVQYSLRDREGNDQRVEAQICEVNAQDEPVECGQPVLGAGGDGLQTVPTVPAGTDTPHRFSWNAGCGRVVNEQCVATEVDTSYVARIRVAHGDANLEDYSVTAPFRLTDLGFQSVPMCDTSVEPILEPCQQGSQ
jgi:hypothetical protein